jgi:acyl-CoA dehydrogenase
MANYFFNPADAERPEISQRNDAANDDFLFHQGPAKGLGQIRFHDYNLVFNSYDLPNVNVFKEQVGVFKEMLARATPSEAQQKDTDFILALGEAFTLVVYGQLILENARIYSVDDDTVDQIFDVMVRDLSKFALQLYGKLSSTPAQMDYCLKLIRRPTVDEARYQRVWSQVHALKDEYEMNP